MARGMAELPNGCQEPRKLIGVDPRLRDGGEELIVENRAPQIDVVNRLRTGALQVSTCSMPATIARAVNWRSPRIPASSGTPGAAGSPPSRTRLHWNPVAGCR